MAVSGVSYGEETGAASKNKKAAGCSGKVGKKLEKRKEKEKWKGAANENGREESKAVRSWTWKREAIEEGGNLGILFFPFYLLKLMSFFWFYLRIMCN